MLRWKLIQIPISQIYYPRGVHIPMEWVIYLRWWTFDSETATVETYEVLVPAHKGIDATGTEWILDGVSNKLHMNY